MIWTKNKKSGRPRTTSRLSRFVRPFVERKRFRFIAGAHLAAATLFVQVLGPIGGTVPAEPVETAVLSAEAAQVLTETTFRMPVSTFTGYSQGFHRFHPGVDIRAVRGTTVYPAADGLVVDVELGRWGYGHKVIVAHANGVMTLYAHLDKVNVEVGNTVTKDAELGAVGMTGWTTGPHLHFEIRGPGGLINPKQVLPEPISS